MDIFDIFEKIITIKCPHCNKTTKAQRKWCYFSNMGRGRAMLHCIMIPLTAMLWVLWLVYSFFNYGKKNICYTCKKQVANQHII